MRTIRIDTLNFDERLYARGGVSEVHVCRLADALREGGELPPILVDAGNLRIVDGVHRTRAARKVFGDDATIYCELRTYASDAEFLAAAIEANSAHGLSFTPYEHARCAVLAEQVGLAKEVLARAMRMPVTKIERIVTTRTGLTRLRASDPPILVPLKGSMRACAGRELTEQQLSANRYAGGMPPLYYVNQLI